MPYYIKKPQLKRKCYSLIAFTKWDKQIFIRRPRLQFKKFIQQPKLQGIKINLSGRLNGVNRSKHLEKLKGFIKAQTFTNPIQAKLRQVQTKWGKFGLHIVLG